MKLLEIEKTLKTPQVVLDDHTLTIIGKSFPEHPVQFYSSIIDYIKQSNIKELIIIFNLEYSSTSSSKFILNMLREIQSFLHIIDVIWNYEEDDEDVFELGQMLEENTELPFIYKIIR